MCLPFGVRKYLLETPPGSSFAANVSSTQDISIFGGACPTHNVHVCCRRRIFVVTVCFAPQRCFCFCKLPGPHKQNVVTVFILCLWGKCNSFLFQKAQASCRSLLHYSCDLTMEWSWQKLYFTTQIANHFPEFLLDLELWTGRAVVLTAFVCKMFICKRQKRWQNDSTPVQ